MATSSPGNSHTHDIVGKLWNLCNVLKDDGVTYHQYVTELTYLLFLKMAKETGQEQGIPWTPQGCSQPGTDQSECRPSPIRTSPTRSAGPAAARMRRPERAGVAGGVGAGSRQLSGPAAPRAKPWRHWQR